MRHVIISIAAGLALAACGGGQSPVSNNAAAPVVDSGGGNAGGGGGDTGGTPQEVGPKAAQLRVLSNRPDLVSAGDVLLELVVPAGEVIGDYAFTRDSGSITVNWEATGENPQRFLAVVDGLSLNDNVIAVSPGNSVTVTNHPVGGPVFTGPQIQPWACQEGADDLQCNQAPAYSLLYKSTNPDSPGLQSYDPDNPPGDVANTTTDNGETIPFIVRREDGFMARDRYSFFTLYKEDEDWTPASPQSQWNRRLLVTHGGNCRGDHNTSSPRVDDYAGTIPTNPAIESSYITALGLGWSTMSTAQLNLGHNCNVSYQAESLMMAKERFIEQYGELRYTVGTGCSGGAISQNMIANSYPGLYQGILTTCTYPDVMSTATQFADYHILLRYFDLSADTPEQPDDFDSFMQQVNNLGTTAAGSSTARDGTPFTVAQQNSIYGHENGIVNASLADSALFAEAVDPQSRCGGVADTVAGDTSTRYHPETNPGGTRCDVLTFMKNMVGARERFDAEGNDRWSANEKALGEGFAGFPLGNEGVQYGLTALNNPEASKLITREQFVAINRNIGALDSDLNITTERLRPDQPSLTNAYRVGILNTGVNMDTVPIINMTGPDPGIAHDSVHGYWLRERLVREHGDRDNFVHWGGSAALIGNANYMNESLIAMAGWLDAIEQDTSANPIAQKIVDNKPATLVDRCEEAQGSMCPDEAMLVYGTPRTVAGNNTRFGDMIQCQLKPVDRSEYEPASLAWTEEQFQEVEALFPTGVCDYSKKPLAWTETIPWLTYQDELGKLITGGEQMQRADFPSGWASPAFAKTWEPGWITSD